MAMAVRMQSTATDELAATSSDSAVRKVFRRLVPVLVVLYVIAYIDRINVGFAALSMNEDLGLTATMFGFANTAFYITYSLFEVPSNMMLARHGARVWIPRIMITWGIASTATMFVAGPYSLYFVRSLIGLAEAGFLPGMLFYLGHWIPAAHRAKANAIFLAALPIALMVGSPLSGLILQLDGWLGLDGWRWLFLIEGLPAVLLGIAAYFLLPDRPADANWLTASEQTDLQRRLDSEQAMQPKTSETHTSGSIWKAIGNRDVITLGVVYFCLVATVNTLGIWSPLIVRELLGNTDRLVLVGFVSAIPPLLAIIGMLSFSAHSDRSGERNRYCATLMALSGVGWLIVVIGASPALKLMGLSICYVGSFSAMAIFWTAANSLLPQGRRAVSIAAVSTIGTFASILSPSIVGVLRDLTSSMTAGVWYAVTLLALGTMSLFAMTVPRWRKA
jgi:MFS transporter, ACS family, 4-hydroxyphenylacetate permease